MGGAREGARGGAREGQEEGQEGRARGGYALSQHRGKLHGFITVHILYVH